MTLIEGRSGKTGLVAAPLEGIATAVLCRLFTDCTLALMVRGHPLTGFRDLRRQGQLMAVPQAPNSIPVWACVSLDRGTRQAGSGGFPSEESFLNLTDCW